MRALLNQVSTKPYIILACFILVSWIIFFESFQNGFISDDWGFVYQIENFGWTAFLQNFTDKFFIPISHFLGAIQYYITGGNPLIQHLIQVTIHALVSWQIFLLCRDISYKNGNKDLVNIGLIAGFLFLVNPFNVEAVAWLASKSYGYTLLFSILAIRTLLKNENSIKNQILFWLLTFIAIHSKEWAYVLPLITFFVLKLTQTKVSKQFWIGLALTFTISIVLRYIALGVLIGGYESGHSYSFSIMSLHIIAYFLKFITYIRFASAEFLPLPLLVISSMIFATFLISILIKTKLKKITILYLFFIIVLTLLPVAGLEMTSFFSNQSDRYSYFALVPFSIVYAYLFINLKKWLAYLSMAAICCLFIYFNLDYNSKWKEASIVQYTFLEKLENEVITDSRVLLYNVPDTYNGIYCMRNGIEPYLKVNNKVVDIEVFQRQDFLEKNGGVIQKSDALFITESATNTYTTFPKGTVEYNSVNFDYAWVDEFNQTLVYGNETFTPLK